MLQLFYRETDNQNFDVEQHITTAGRHYEHFFVDSHRDEYDHANVDPRWNGCFCNLPDPTDPKWPKLFDNYEFIASGAEAILAIDISALPDVQLPHLLPGAKK
jgi:hypothetical protein